MSVCTVEHAIETRERYLEIDRAAQGGSRSYSTRTRRRSERSRSSFSRSTVGATYARACRTRLRGRTWLDVASLALLAAAVATLYPYLIPSSSLAPGMTIFDAAPKGGALVEIVAIVVVALIVVYSYLIVVLRRLIRSRRRCGRARLTNVLFETPSM